MFDEIFEEKKLNRTRIDKISVCILAKLSDFLKPWEYVMSRIQSSKVPSIYTVTPCMCIISSPFEAKPDDQKQGKS